MHLGLAILHWNFFLTVFDFHFSFLPVYNSLEWCSKHFQLRNNISNSTNKSNGATSHVIVAGELYKTESSIKINTHSGSYTKRMISSNNDSAKFNKIAKHLLSLHSNAHITITNNSILPKEPINLKNIPIEVIQSSNARVGLPGFAKRKIEENAPKGQKTKLVKQARNNLRKLVKKAKKNT